MIFTQVGLKTIYIHFTTQYFFNMQYNTYQNKREKM